MAVRGHEPIDLSNMKGLWDRGDIENVPLDHMSDCNNIEFFGNNFRTRDGIGISQTVAAPLENVKRIYNYPTQTANTTLVLTYDGTTGNIYHVVNASTVFLILTIAGMEDFAFVPYAGRAYISPFKSFTTGDLNIQKGMQNEFLYVYLGAGAAARKAGGAAAVGSLTIVPGGGTTDPGLHLYGVVGETDSGFLSQPIALTTFTNTGTGVSFSTVPVFTGAQWVKRHIVATKAISGVYSGNTTGYEYFFIPNGTINDNTTTVLNNLSYFDIDLLENASHLFDNYVDIPAGACLWLYHDRLCLACTFTDISLILISAAGEPEAISQIDGLIIVPPDGNPITNGAELRDVMYVFKRAFTTSYIDNEEEPSSWPDSTVDPSLGTCVHGIGTVLDSGKSTVDFLVVATFAGVYLFNGRYIAPELSWKISNFWANQDRDEYRKIQIAVSTIRKVIYIVLPDTRLLTGNYENGMDPKNIRWSPSSWYTIVNCVAIVNIDEIIIGCEHPSINGS